MRIQGVGLEDEVCGVAGPRTHRVVSRWRCEARRDTVNDICGSIDIRGMSSWPEDGWLKRHVGLLECLGYRLEGNRM